MGKTRLTKYTERVEQIEKFLDSDGYDEGYIYKKILNLTKEINQESKKTGNLKIEEQDEDTILKKRNDFNINTEENIEKPAVKRKKTLGLS